ERNREVHVGAVDTAEDRRTGREYLILRESVLADHAPQVTQAVPGEPHPLCPLVEELANPALAGARIGKRIERSVRILRQPELRNDVCNVRPKIVENRQVCSAAAVIEQSLGLDQPGLNPA